MNAKAEAIKAACEYAIKKWPAQDGRTFCNIATAHIAVAAGFDGFKGMIANEMVALMKKSPDFVKVGPEEATKLANDGKLVIAGKMDEPHGHVTPILPGGPVVYSKKWHQEVPTCANVGSINGIMGVNWAFETCPMFWVLI